MKEIIYQAPNENEEWKRSLEEMEDEECLTDIESVMRSIKLRYLREQLKIISSKPQNEI